MRGGERQRMRRGSETVMKEARKKVASRRIEGYRTEADTFRGALLHLEVCIEVNSEGNNKFPGEPEILQTFSLDLNC